MVDVFAFGLGARFRFLRGLTGASGIADGWIEDIWIDAALQLVGPVH